MPSGKLQAPFYCRASTRLSSSNESGCGIAGTFNPKILCCRDLSLRAEALASCKECEVEHSAEVGTWENLGRLLNDVRACVR